MCKVDRLFAQAFLDEAASKFFNVNPNTAHLSLRDLVNSITGFENRSTLAVSQEKVCTVYCHLMEIPACTNLAANFQSARVRLHLGLFALSTTG